MTGDGHGGDPLARGNDKVRRSWAKQATRYDKSMGFFERRVFGEGHRDWACSKASGRTLEVAVGTGLNLPRYRDGVVLTGLDLSPEMLAIARKRASDLGMDADLHEGDAHALPFADASFDTVICTYALCNIPDPARAIGEMTRVVRPGGKIVLVDHVASPVAPVLWFQKMIEFFSRRFEGEHMTRRPAEHVRRHALEITEQERHGFAGMVERLVAVRTHGT